MYALMYKAGSFLGVFSSKAKMRTLIETIIKDNYEDSGTYGNFNFRWVKFNVDEPWFTIGGKEPSKESRAILSLFKYTLIVYLNFSFDFEKKYVINFKL